MQVGANKGGGTARKEKLGWNGGTRGSFPSSAASLCGLQKKKKKEKLTFWHVWCQYQWKQTSACKTIDYIVDLESNQILDQGCFSLK